MVIIVAADNKFKHLTRSDREIIETGIRNGSTQKAIADTISKQNSAVGKEIRQHREISYKCALPVECAVYQKCRFSETQETNRYKYIKVVFLRWIFILHMPFYYV